MKNFHIYSSDLNLLNLPEENLKLFVIKIFSELKFFERLSIDEEYFENFLKDVKTGYNIHQNPFHNFTHGVNGTF